MSTKCTLTGGNFQDSEGNLLANGYLIFKLSQDSVVNSSTQVCSGIEIKITLDVSGNVNSGQAIWGNDALLPVNSFYKVTGYAANGQLGWGPNNQQVVGSTFNLGTWIPNQVISWQPSVQPVLLETNGTPNSIQSLLNIAGPDVTYSGGTVTIAGGGTVPAGQNVYPTFNTQTGGNLSGGGRTGASVIGSRQIMATPSTWKFSIAVGGGGVTLGSLVILKTLADDLNVISSTPYTFGGSPNPSLPDGISTSDPISLQIDTAHDYWVMYVINIISAGHVAYGPVPTGGSVFLKDLSTGYFWTTNVTGTTPINTGTGIAIGTQLNQVLSA